MTALLQEEATTGTVQEFVTNIGSFVLGLGILGALVAYALRANADRIQRKRERKGLLRLLAVEVYHNDMALSGFEKDLQLITIQSVPGTSTKVWEDIRVRLSQLLKEENQFADIATYYDTLQAVDASRLDITTPEKARRDMVRPMLPILRKQTDTVIEHTRGYLPSRVLTTKTPRFMTGKTPEMWEKERKEREGKTPRIDVEEHLRGVRHVLFVERTQRIPPTYDHLTRVLGTERGEGDLKHLKDWTIVSHSFTLQADGSAIFSYILERPPSRDNLPPQEPKSQ